MNYDAYNWIATRSLVDENGKHAGIVRVSAPRLVGEAWECVAFYDSGIGGPEKPVVALGIDGLQALVVVLEGLRKHLRTAHPTLSWLGGPGAGLAATLPLGLGADFHDRLEKTVDDEVAAYVETLKPKKTG